MNPAHDQGEVAYGGVTGFPSHAPFDRLIDIEVRGSESPYFDLPSCDDHVADLCMLKHHDIDEWLWASDPLHEGSILREEVYGLAERVSEKKDIEAAEILFSVATLAAYEVMNLYLRERGIFDHIAPRRKILPTLGSIHPKTAEVMGEMIKASALGTMTDDARRRQSRAWFSSDAPAHVYARAIIASVKLNRDLEPVEAQQRAMDRFDRGHGTKTVVLPVPEWVAGMERLPIPMTPESVDDYWKKGKEIILAEYPRFWERPEWESYHARHYGGGAKPGAIRSAIFRDIRAALRTFAGAGRKIRKT